MTAAGFEPPFEYPVVVKPSNSVAYWNCDYPGKKKVFVVQNADEMRRILAGVYSETSTYRDAMIVQDFVPGDDTCMRVMNCYSDSHGKVKMMALGDVLLEARGHRQLRRHHDGLQRRHQRANQGFP